MKATRALLVCLIVGALVALIAPPLLAQNQAKELRVKLTYSGPGTVDTTHGIHVYVFDTPEINEGSMPIAMDSVYENGGEVTFNYITQSPVYLAATYGDFDPMSGPPPSGAPVALYKPGDVNMPTPIPMDKDKVAVEFTFDDSMKMP
jgi:hypothetical protein